MVYYNNMESLVTSAEHAALRPLEAFRHHQADVSRELNELAQGHAEKSGGMLTLLDADPDTYPAQKVTRAWVDSTPATLGTIIDTANAAEPRFDQMRQRLLDDEGTSMMLSHIGEDLRSGMNIVIVTNHGEIKDIAVALAAFHATIRETDTKWGYESDFTTNMLLSKMVAHLGFYGIEPVTATLGQMCDRQYFSFPQTDSIRNSRISPKLVETYNKALRAAIKARMHTGGNLFAIAPSGTIDKALDPENPDALTLATVGPGTEKLLTHKKTKVLPVVAWNQDGQFVFEPLGIPRHLQDGQSVQSMMGDISDVLNMSIEGKSFEYTARSANPSSKPQELEGPTQFDNTQKS